MPSNQFRQVGVPDARRTTTEVRRHLRRVQQRTGTLLSRPRLPTPTTLLRTLTALQGALELAYDRLQLRRLAMLQESLVELRGAVEQGLWLDDDRKDETRRQLRYLYQNSSRLLHDLQTPRSAKRNDEVEQQFQTFLETAANRGWKVPPTADAAPEIDDGVEQSCRYIDRVSVSPDQLLGPGDDFGLVSCSLLLLNDPPIPESTLVGWTRPPYNLDVYIVFGYYVVIPQAHVLGVHPNLATIEGAEGIDAVNINRFLSIADRLENGSSASSHHLIHYPRRVLHHYYCPMMGLQWRDRRYFQKWDVLISANGNQKDTEQHGNTENRPRGTA